MSTTQQGRPAFAIIRVDEFLGGEAALPNRIKVKRIVWSLEHAETEIQRLRGLSGEGCTYFWQATRVDREPPDV
jgi:hypothetical protein